MAMQKKAENPDINENEIVLPSTNQPTLKNAWKIIKSLNSTQRITLASVFLGWSLDAFDFFVVSFAIPYIAEDFNMESSEIASRFS